MGSETAAIPPVCSNPENCCRELSRVWQALGITSYTGKSASEEVSAIVAALAAAEQGRTQGEWTRGQVLKAITEGEALSGLCEPGCEGRCRMCPGDWRTVAVRMLRTYAETLPAASAARLPHGRTPSTPDTSTPAS